ncbi:hypothetical protein [Metabacillus idriensis]|uniref:hypothetical protein n=1 Tax=Metabacillus idriensis TaxID=324768 RepID=UPI00174DB40C|nr:hypothetical protein [Metabacillus idriensis]
MKTKGNTRRVKRHNFWGKYEKDVPYCVKEMVYNQYLSNDTLFVYCDSSAFKEQKNMAIACAYVWNGTVIVKHQFVNPPKDCWHKNIYAEIKAVNFALTHYEKHINSLCKKVIIFSDVDDIEGFVSNAITFKKITSLKKLQFELIALYQKAKMKNSAVDIEIKYLTLEQKRYNPFAKTAHNAAIGLLKGI